MIARGERPAIALVNGNVLTLDAAQPAADTVLIRGGHVSWVGFRQDLSPATLSNADVFDCRGRTVIPGFIDAHCHVLGYAASLTAVDCSPRAVKGISDIQREITLKAKSTDSGEWIRAADYSEFDLLEQRHPTRWDLDRASRQHPVRLNHRSGHACVLNSLALERVGIDDNTEEPPGATISRDLGSGKPDGLLLEMDAWLDQRIPPISSELLSEGVSKASRQFLSQGVTVVSDATATNSTDRFQALNGFAERGKFAPFLVVMPSAYRLDEFYDAGLSFGDATAHSSLGHAKIMLTRTGGSLYPDKEELHSLVEGAHLRGFPVAIHCVESDAVIAAALALSKPRTPGLRDRIEHASECPPEALIALARAKPVVVSQPNFIRDKGKRYLCELGEDAKWLYRFKAISDRGIVLAASSDAPVSTPNPLAAMHAAVTRQADSGEVVAKDEGLTAMQALEMHTKSAAYAICGEDEMGTISPGKRADLVVLSEDPTEIEPERLTTVRVEMTVIAGQLLWQE